MASFVPTTRSSSYPAVSPTRPELSVKGKSVLVTGGGYGIGSSIAHAFAAAGAARIAISGRTESKLKSTADELNATYPSTTTSYYIADITDAKAVAAMFKSFGAPDILINNAGLLPDVEPVKTVDLKSWWKGFEVNVLGTATVTQNFLRAKKADGEAVVISLNTVAAHWGDLPGFTSYASSKAAELRLVEALQAENPEVRFVSVHPGFVETAMGDKAREGGVTGLAVTDPELAAHFILWLASPEADFLRGKFTWANWDIEELKAKKSDIVENNLLRYTIAGF
ncbi:NAD(P)-binding protein [Glonium stellatum]|uniref:NAD(P)-binding protein n=1 Tax=Glonium stellatum TaxID=574774 RepID=A0A8E2FAJ1_9PEZI|nr:NAD(P)-binding protein [Glonium stellatum]